MDNSAIIIEERNRNDMQRGVEIMPSNSIGEDGSRGPLSSVEGTLSRRNSHDNQ